MKTKVFFLLMILVQFTVPGWMIYSSETILSQGTLWKFKTAPVDPYDVFRGRFVALAVEQSVVDYDGSTDLVRNQTVYAVLEKDSEGFANIRQLLLSAPREGDYLEAKVSYHQRQDYQFSPVAEKPEVKVVNKVHLRIPFDRYYMNEKNAPKAEELYRRLNSERNKAQQAFISVRLLKGKALIEELFLDGKPVSEMI